MTKDTKALLKQLVDAPFGHAEKILREEGFWDERRSPNNDQLKIYRIRVTGERTADFDEVVTVEATSDDQAEELASEKAEKEFGDDVYVRETRIITRK